jgi:DNA-binding response OmpR family regulator
MVTPLLIAEPDALQRDLFDLLFAVDGFEITVVTNGADTLAYLREHTPAAIILAMDLPDIAGAAICQKAKAVSRLARVPVVLVAPRTGAGAALDDAVRSVARRAGADLLVQKPLGDKNLRERVQRLIAVARAVGEPTPAAVFNTSSLTFDVPSVALALGSERAETPPAQAPRPPTERSRGRDDLVELQAELERLRDENAQLKSRLAATKAKLDETQQSLEAEQRGRQRGLFGRRP